MYRALKIISLLAALAVAASCSSERSLPKASEDVDANVGASGGAAGGNLGGGGAGLADAGSGLGSDDGSAPLIDLCPKDERRCSSGAIEECRDGAWTQVMTCGGFCLNKACVACKPDAKKCDGSAPQVCDATGSWTASGAACDTGCNAETGLCNGCPTTGQRTCTGKDVFVCSPDKKWVKDVTCSATQGCIAGACTACDPGVSPVACQDARVRECATNGEWKEKVVCENFQVCGVDRCLPTYASTVTIGVVESVKFSTIFQDGSAILVGRFKGSVDFDPTPKVALLAGGPGAWFVLRVAGDNSVVWAKAFSGNILMNSLSPGSDFGALLTGSFFGSADFAGRNESAATQGTNFIIRISKDGTLDLRAFKETSAASWSITDAISRPTGESTFVGRFSGTLQFDVDGAGYTSIPDNTNGFVATLTTAGKVSSVQQIRALNNGQVSPTNVIRSTSGGLWIGGLASGEIDLDPTAGIDNRLVSRLSFFMLRLDAGGAYRAGKILDVANIDFSTRLVALAGTSDDGVVVGGNLYADSGAIDLDPGTEKVSKTAIGENDFFVIKLNKAGEYQWGNVWGGSAWDELAALQTHSTDEVLVSGSFKGNLNFANEQSPVLRSASDGAAFAMVLKPNGELRLVLNTGGAEGSASAGFTQTGFAMSGIFMGSVDFQPGNGVEFKEGSPSLFLSRYSL